MRCLVYVWNKKKMRYEERPGFKLDSIRVEAGSTHVYLDFSEIKND